MSDLTRLAWQDRDAPELSAVLDGIWRLLEAAAEGRGHGFRTPGLATRDAALGSALRSVVLRGARRQGRRLRFYSDRRSRKVAEIAAESRVALLFYDGPAGVQVRVNALARVHGEAALARAAWADLAPASRRDYQAPAAPGTPCPAPVMGLVEATDHGFENFAVVDCAAWRLDWLHLDPRGHRRAVFTWDDAEHPRATWVVP